MACPDPIRGEFGSTLRSVANLKGFKIASLNVNSLLKRIGEIRLFYLAHLLIFSL